MAIETNNKLTFVVGVDSYAQSCEVQQVLMAAGMVANGQQGQMEIICTEEQLPELRRICSELLPGRELQAGTLPGVAKHADSVTLAKLEKRLQRMLRLYDAGFEVQEMHTILYMAMAADSDRLIDLACMRKESGASLQEMVIGLLHDLEKATS